MAGCDITSLYVSMYKRDYYMHHKDQLPITELAKSSEVSRVRVREHGVDMSE